LYFGVRTLTLDSFPQGRLSAWLQELYNIPGLFSVGIASSFKIYLILLLNPIEANSAGECEGTKESSEKWREQSLLLFVGLKFLRLQKFIHRFLRIFSVWFF
jgi:hypothetical protein